MVYQGDRGRYVYAAVPQRETRHQRLAQERAARTRGHILVFAAFLLTCLGIGLAANIGMFYWNSERGGQQLLLQASQEISSGSAASLAACEGRAQLPNPLGILTAPTIGLRAPVVQGTSDAQLDDAVGHETASALPARQGTSVLAAHDVTWFTDIDNLSNGQMLDYQNACATYQFRVFSHSVVTAGTPVYAARGIPQLVLVTCWPTDALFLTSKRYVVYASLARTISNVRAAPQAGTIPSGSLTVPAPASLVAQAADQGLPLGVLRFTGTPAATWQESPAPIQVESSALSEFRVALLSVEQGNQGDWADITDTGGAPWPGISALTSAQIAHFNQGVSLTINANGSTTTTVGISTVVVLAGGSAPGVYNLSMTETNANGTLVVTGWQLSVA
jgi:LPXTG-site transpeptidase (sortase) family protein